MGPYSHIVIASQFEKAFELDNIQEFYWGAVAPDVRYLVIGMPRKQTHISTKRIFDYLDLYPHLEDFLKGYLIHCLADELDLPRLIHSKIPFRLQKKEFSYQYCSVILEFFNIERTKPVGWSISGTSNVVLRELGVEGEEAKKFAQEINRYITSPTYMSSVTLYQNLGFESHERIEKYRAAVLKFQSNWLQKNLILLGLQIGNINKAVTTAVKFILPKMEMGKDKFNPISL